MHYYTLLYRVMHAYLFSWEIILWWGQHTPGLRTVRTGLDQVDDRVDAGECGQQSLDQVLPGAQLAEAVGGAATHSVESGCSSSGSRSGSNIEC